MALISSYITARLNELEEIYTTLRLKKITLSKTEATKIVGGRYQLERLVAIGKIRMVKPADAPNGKWRCNGEDVFRCMNYKRRSKN